MLIKGALASTAPTAWGRICQQILAKPTYSLYTAYIKWIRMCIHVISDIIANTIRCLILRVPTESNLHSIILPARDIVEITRSH